MRQSEKASFSLSTRSWLNFDGLTHYLKAATHRLQDAGKLLQPPQLNASRSDTLYRHTTGAAYLAGYTVECMLKAYILRRYGFQSFAEAQQKGSRLLKPKFALMTTSKGHDLSLLLQLTDLEKRMENNERMKANWGICRKWSSGLRYDPSASASSQGNQNSLKSAKEFVIAVREFHDCIYRMMGF